MKIKVAIADDHRLFIDGIKSILSTEINIDIVIEAANGLELLKIMDKGELPDVIITDIRMPVMNGIATTKELRKKYPKIPVLALTMFDQSADVFEMLKAGAKGYITKDIGKGELLQAINKLISGGVYFSKNLPDGFMDWDFDTQSKKELVLTRREKEILALIVKGRTTLQISKELKLSKFTVDTHRKNIHKKLQTGSNTELIKYAMQNKNLFFK